MCTRPILLWHSVSYCKLACCGPCACIWTMKALCKEWVGQKIWRNPYFNQYTGQAYYRALHLFKLFCNNWSEVMVSCAVALLASARGRPWCLQPRFGLSPTAAPSECVVLPSPPAASEACEIFLSCKKYFLNSFGKVSFLSGQWRTLAPGIGLRTYKSNGRWATATESGKERQVVLQMGAHPPTLAAASH